MPFYRVDVVARLRDLAAHLVELKHRVRRAVASETGRAVADAVKDLVVAVLDGTVCRDPYVPSSACAPYRPDYDDPGPDEWDDCDERYDDPPASQYDRDAVRRTPSSFHLSTALNRTAAVVSGWAERRLPGWAAAAVGVVAAASAAVGEPLLRVVLAAADLLPHVF